MNQYSWQLLINFNSFSTEILFGWASSRWPWARPLSIKRAKGSKLFALSLLTRIPCCCCLLCTGILLKSFDIAQLETGITKSFPSVTVFNIWLTQLCTHTCQYGTFVSDNSDLCLVLLAFLSCLNSCLACIILLLVSPCQLVPTCLPLFDLFLCIWEKNVHSTEELIEICTNPGCFRAWLSTERFLFCFKDFYTWGAPFSRKFLIKLKIFR